VGCRPTWWLWCCWRPARAGNADAATSSMLGTLALLCAGARDRQGRVHRTPHGVAFPAAARGCRTRALLPPSCQHQVARRTAATLRALRGRMCSIGRRQPGGSCGSPSCAARAQARARPANKRPPGPGVGCRSSRPPRP
jgi:hypothetical protein